MRGHGFLKIETAEILNVFVQQSMLTSYITNYPSFFIVYSGAYWLAFGYHGYFFFLSVNLLKIILNATKKESVSQQRRTVPIYKRL